MRIKRFNRVSMQRTPPHPHTGKLLFRAATASEQNTLMGFIEYGMDRFRNDEVAVIQLINDEGISVWVSAQTPERLSQTLDAIIATFEEKMSVTVSQWE